jgi:hypothetical protein
VGPRVCFDLDGKAWRHGEPLDGYCSGCTTAAIVARERHQARARVAQVKVRLVRAARRPEPNPLGRPEGIMNAATTTCGTCGGSAWLGVARPCPDCQGHECEFCGRRAVVVWHLGEDGQLTEAVARCWEHRHLRFDEIKTREQLRAACATLCEECDGSRATYPRVARFRGDGVEAEGWHHVCEEEESEVAGWVVQRCEATALRDQVDPHGVIEGEPGTWMACLCPCHAGNDGPWMIDGCFECEDRDAYDVVEAISEVLPVKVPGRCPVGAAIHVATERDELRREVAAQAAELQRLRELAQELDGRRQEAEAEARRLRSASERLQAAVARLRRLVDTDDTEEGE